MTEDNRNQIVTREVRVRKKLTVNADRTNENSDVLYGANDETLVEGLKNNGIFDTNSILSILENRRKQYGQTNREDNKRNSEGQTDQRRKYSIRSKDSIR